MNGENLMNKKKVLNACDTLDSSAAREILAGKRLGLLTNMSGVTRDLRPTSALLAEKLDLRLLIGPEHGILGAKQGGGSDGEVFNDPLTGLPVYSVYGSESNRERTESALGSVDMIVCDIQDIGIRYYTYQYSMLEMMRYCAKYRLPLVVLDRVNPLGGTKVSGNLAEPEFVNERWMVAGQPVEAGLTIGEIARFYNDTLRVGCELTVLPVSGWERGMYFDDTDLLFVAPSPNMPTLDTVLLYTGTCLIEATNVSEGRGTTKPFELFGAPWIDGNRLADEVDRLRRSGERAFDGVVFRACNFTPVFSKYAGELCGGAQIHISDREALDPFRLGLRLLELLRDMYPGKFAFLPKTVRYLLGTEAVMSDEFTADSFIGSQAKALEAFGSARKNWMIY